MRHLTVLALVAFILPSTTYAQTPATSAGTAFAPAGSNYGEVPFNTTINPLIFTYEIWARLESKTEVGGNGIFQCQSQYDPSTYGGVQIDVNPSTYKVRAQITNGNYFYSPSSWVSIEGPMVINALYPDAGLWYHLAITFDGSTFSFYVNGNLMGSVSGISYLGNQHDPDNVYTNFPLWIASNGFSVANNHLHGAVDEFRIWNVVRSQNQIIHDMTSSLSGTESGLVGYWRFDEGSGTSTADLTGNGSTMSLSADSWETSGGAFPAPYASLNTGSLSFGHVHVGNTDTMSVTLSNLGSIDLTVSSASVPYGTYTVVPSSSAIAPDSSKIFQVIFAPTAVGSQSGNLVFNHNAAIPQSTVSLSGAGVNFQPATSAGFALRFDGINPQAVYVGADPLPFATDVTFETWVRVEGGAGTSRRIAADHSPGDIHPNGFILSLNTSNQLILQIGNLVTTISLTGPVLPLNEWTHIAFTYTYSANEARLYVNGIDIQDRILSFYRANSLGTLLLGGFSNFPGSFDEVRIWNVARTAEQIRSTMNTSLAGNESGLHAYWRLDDSTGTLALDQTGNGFDGLMGTNSIDDTVQAVWIPSTIPLGYGSSMNDSNFTSGSATLPGVSFATVDTFDNPVEVTGTEIFSSPNLLPSASTLLTDRYWVMNVFGTPGTYSLNMAFDVPSSFTNNGTSPVSLFNLYSRSSTSDSSWTLVRSGASSVTADSVVFDTVSSLGQFTIGSGTPLPVELVSFTGSSERLDAELTWTTATEVDNYGFEVQRSPVGNKSSALTWVKAGFVQGSGTSNSSKKYSFTDSNIPAGKYSYRLKQIDRAGGFKYSAEIDIAVGAAPKVFELSQNFPNPFNPATNIQFTVPTDGRVLLIVYNALGQEVATMFDGNAVAGEYHQATFDASRLASGIYFSRLEFNGKMLTKKMLLLK